MACYIAVLVIMKYCDKRCIVCYKCNWMYTVHVYMQSAAIIYQAKNNLIHNAELNSPPS